MKEKETAEASRNLTLAEAIREALSEEMARDSSVFVMGQDVGTIPGGWGGPFTAVKGLVEEFGKDRVRNAPISEKAIVGASVGAAMMGMRPVCEVQYADFVFCCMDEIVNAAAKMKSMSGGQFSVPMVFRAPTGASSRGAQHAQSPEGVFMHYPGLKVVAPSTPYDAKGLLKAAVRDNAPVLFFEHKLLYGSKGGHRKDAMAILDDRPVPLEDYTIPIGKADVKRAGKDVTLVALLKTVHQSLAAAKELEKEGVDCEVVDLRSLAPLDFAAIRESAAKTGRVIVVEEDNKTLGWGSEVLSFLMEECFSLLKGPARRVAALDVPIPFYPKLENCVIPTVDKIVEAVRKNVKG